jgi:hypothetical protein
MSAGSLKASEEVIKQVTDRITEMLSIIEAEKDLRKVLAYNSALRLAVRTIAEINKTEENVFVSWLTWRFNSEMYSYYGGKKDEFYVINKGHSEKTMKIYKDYLESLKKGVEEKSVEKVVSATAKAVLEIDLLSPSRVDIEE